jgi:hypothetical protein
MSPQTILHQENQFNRNKYYYKCQHYFFLKDCDLEFDRESKKLRSWQTGGVYEMRTLIQMEGCN